VPKLRLAGLSSTTVAAPLRVTLCGLLGALSVIDNFPLRPPLFVGEKITLIVQLATAARLDPQLFDALKSPVATMLAMLSGNVP